MNKELQFSQALEKIKEISKIQENVIDEVQLTEALDGLDLNDAQMQLVYEYLNTQKIGIGTPLDIEDVLLEEDFHYLDFYMQEIANITPLSESEKRAYLMGAMANDQIAADKIIENMLAQVVDIAKLYAGQGALIEDLIGEGNVALTLGVQMIGAAEDPKDAEAMLTKMIMDSMEAYVQEVNDVSLANHNTLNKINELNDASKELAELFHRDVTKAELATEMNIDIDEIDEAIRLTANKLEFIENDND